MMCRYIISERTGCIYSPEEYFDMNHSDFIYTDSYVVAMEVCMKGFLYGKGKTSKRLIPRGLSYLLSSSREERRKEWKNINTV